MTAGSGGTAWQLRGCVLAGRLRDTDLSIRFGEVLALVGANGAGKSSLLALLAGDLEPSAGELCYAGRPVRGSSVGERARQRAVLLQHAADPVPLLARTVLALAGMPFGAPTLPAEELCSAFEVGDLLDRSMASLAGGERQRIHIARVLGQVWRRPDTGLLLDEPCNHLDVRHQQRLARVLRDAAAAGHAVVVAAHDLAFALAVADRIALLEAGKVQLLPSAAALADEALLARVFGAAIPMTWVGGRPIVDVFGTGSTAVARDR